MHLRQLNMKRDFKNFNLIFLLLLQEFGGEANCKKWSHAPNHSNSCTHNSTKQPHKPNLQSWIRFHGFHRVGYLRWHTTQTGTPLHWNIPTIDIPWTWQKPWHLVTCLGGASHCHLDLEIVEALVKAFAKFKVLVSHDKYLIERAC